MSHQRGLTGAGPFLRRTILPQDDAGGALALLDEAYSQWMGHAPGRGRPPEPLLLLAQQRHLLAVSRHFLESQLTLQRFVGGVWERLQRGPRVTSDLFPVCRRLRALTRGRESLLKKLRGGPCLHPASSDPALQDMPRLLLLMLLKATLLTEVLIEAVLQRAALTPSDLTPDLCRALALYNQTVAELANPMAPLAKLRPFTIHRTLEILAEQRGRALSEKLCCSLEGDMKGHTQMPGQSPPPPSERLSDLIEEDRSQVTPGLQALAGLDERKGALIGSESAMYEQYSALLWTVLSSHVFHAFYPGRLRTPESASAITYLEERLAAESLPEPGANLCRSLCQHLLYTQAAIEWDRAVCRALSSALTDKCAPSLLDSGDPAPLTHSRTSGSLMGVCQSLSRSLAAVTPPPSSALCDSASLQQGLLSRSILSLQMCAGWLRGRAHLYASSGAVSPLVLITHGDLPVLKAECRSLVAAMDSAAWLPLSQPLRVKMRGSQDVLEGLLLSLPHLLGSVCDNRARQVFQQMMPAGRHWRARTPTGLDPAVSEYAVVALGSVVQPVLDGVRGLCEEERGAAVSAALSVFMEAWMSHILREKLTFSLQGALQLKHDFESARDLLRSREAGLSPEEVQAALSLPVFVQADNAIVCLLQQPSRKTYLQPGGCALFWCCPPMCRVAVESVSDSLQSLDRRAWQRGVSGRLPRHSHDSYLPHNQRQWLSLRLHKRWNSLSLTPPWEGREVSEG